MAERLVAEEKRDLDLLGKIGKVGVLIGVVRVSKQTSSQLGVRIWAEIVPDAN